MKFLIDIKYIKNISLSLRNFKEKGRNVFNFSCPLCGDSKKDKTKARAYLFEKKGTMFYYCHNCHASSQFGTFLKTFNKSVFDEYVMERYKSQQVSGRDSYKTPEKVKKVLMRKNNVGIPCVLELDDSHKAKLYLKYRKIPIQKWTRLYYTDNFGKWGQQMFPDSNSKQLIESERIVIPYFNENNELIGAQGRSIDKNEKMRYLSVRASDDEHFIYGQDLWNKKIVTLVTEGPIDSLFLENSLAVSCSDLSGSIEKLIESKNIDIDKQRIICVFDNERRNKQLIDMMKKAIHRGYSITIWNKLFTKEKDINDMILSGKTRKEIIEFILKNSYNGLKAEHELNNFIKGK